jgi:DNA-binding response OmpR family regulator
MRTTVLANAGFAVLPADKVSSALDALANHSFDVLVLCDRLAASDAKRLAGAFRFSSPRGSIVVVKSEKGRGLPVSADLAVDALRGAASLINAVRAAADIKIAA